MTLNESMLKALKELLSGSSLVINPRENGCYSVHPPAAGPAWFRTDDALTLSAANRLISSLADQTNSRSELEECRDVMAKLEKMVSDA